MKTALPVLSALLPLLASCSSSGTTAQGPSPDERVRAVKERPLSDDPDSALHKMRSADGAVGFNVAEF